MNVSLASSLDSMPQVRSRDWEHSYSLASSLDSMPEVWSGDWEHSYSLASSLDSMPEVWSGDWEHSYSLAYLCCNWHQLRLGEGNLYPNSSFAFCLPCLQGNYTYRSGSDVLMCTLQVLTIIAVMCVNLHHSMLYFVASSFDLAFSIHNRLYV